MITVRIATADDAPALSSLLSAYMQETFQRAWGGSVESLVRDGCGARFESLLALRSDALVGFASWTRAYDLHHCVAGGDLIDLYVVPECRARGVAADLVAAVAARIQASGGGYVSGMAVRGSEKLYARLAMQFPGTACIVGGRAFRTLADLAGRPARDIVRGLPSRNWNYQA